MKNLLRRSPGSYWKVKQMYVTEHMRSFLYDHFLILSGGASAPKCKWTSGNTTLSNRKQETLQILLITMEKIINPMGNCVCAHTQNNRLTLRHKHMAVISELRIKYET